MKSQLVSSDYHVIFGSLPSHSEKTTLSGINPLKKKKSLVFFIIIIIQTLKESKEIIIVFCFPIFLLSEFTPLWLAIKSYRNTMNLFHFQFPEFLRWWPVLQSGSQTALHFATTCRIPATIQLHLWTPDILRKTG